ncbi:MAG: hypothetical protein ACLSAP_05795 [Oscillospiraceae bacterium]
MKQRQAWSDWTTQPLFRYCYCLYRYDTLAQRRFICVKTNTGSDMEEGPTGFGSTSAMKMG